MAGRPTTSRYWYARARPAVNWGFHVDLLSSFGAVWLS